MDWKRVGNIEGYYGGVYIGEHEGKYYWQMQDQSSVLSKLDTCSDNIEEIPKYLYDSLLSYSSKKDSQKHIKSNIKSELAKENVAICGESIAQFDWFLQDIEHAVASSINEEGLLPCPNCVSVIINALKS